MGKKLFFLLSELSKFFYEEDLRKSDRPCHFNMLDAVFKIDRS